MRFEYDPETDSLYIDFSLVPSVESVEVAAGVVADFDQDGNLVGDLDHASERFDLTTFDPGVLPIR